MGSSCKDLERSLLEAIEIEKGNIPLTQKENMPAPTFIASDTVDRIDAEGEFS